MASQTEVSIQEFVSKQKQLLESELRAEEDNNVNSSKKDGGFILRNIDVINTSVGLYGRTVVSFGNTIQQSTTQSSEDNETSTKESTTESKLLLPAHRLTVGDEVQILPNNGKGFKTTKKSKAAGGVICACDDVSISVALFSADNNVQQSKSSLKKKQEKKKEEDDNNEDEEDMLGGNPPYAMIPKSNIEVHNKMISSIDQLAKQGTRHPIAGDVVLAAFEPNTSKHNIELTSSRIETLESELDLKCTNLDYSQRQAVVMALHSNSPINLIHGPPGTGKTTTVAELIRCAVHNMGWKVLVTAPSNVAVDNVLERVMSIEHEKQDSTCKRRGRGSKKTSTSMKKIRAVRLGHPARIQHGIQKYSLESLVQSSEGTEIVQDCRSDLNEHLKTLSNPKSRGPEKRVAYKEMKALKKEIRTREEKVVGEILRNSNVVLATNVGAASSLFNRMSDTKGEPISFDLVIIDEGAQALEASCWIPLLRGKRAVLAGDHKQLPPTIKCNVREVQQGLGRTLFERLMLAYDKNTPNCRSKMLEVQYRMHKNISDWSSEAMYNGKLISHDSVKDRQLSTLPVVSEKMATQTEKEDDSSDGLENVTMMLIDTTGCDMHEIVNDAGSRYNEGEANIVVSHVHSLIKLGLRAQDIAVITPYNGQVELLRKLLLPDIPKLEIRSVDGFQGGEREAVVLSLVRSSEKGGQDGIGFLSDERRLNVAITRAKRHVAVICDCETVSKNKFIKGLIDWLEEKGDYRSGVEYEIDSIISSDSLQAKISSTIDKPQKQNIANNKQKYPKKSSKKQPSTKSKNTFPKTDKTEYSRAELMQRITLFSQQGKQGHELNLSLNSEYDCVIAKELGTQLGLGCHDSGGTNKMVLSIIKETKTVKPITDVQPTTEDKEPDVTSTTSKFAQLVEDDSSVSSVEESKPANTPNNLLRELALERETRQSQQPKAPPPPSEAKPSIPPSKKKKSKKKGNNKKAKAKKEEDKDDQLDDLDDLAFLDAQIDKVQNSHGRKIEAKGKGYRSIVNGVLLSTPQGQTAPKKNKAASSALQNKLKAKAQDRTAKKKKK